MSRFRAFITPFKDDGTYADEIEVTNDVDFSSISTVKQQLDQNEFKVGLLTFNDLNLNLRNERGTYSDIDELNSIFRFRRSDSLFKLKWELDSEPPYCGVAICGKAHLSPLVDIYEGFINDDGTTTDIKTENVRLKVLGLESIITKIEISFASVNIGDLFSEILYTLLNQTTVTDLFTVDIANFTVGTDQTIDDKEFLRSKTGKEVLDEILLHSNSVMYIKDRVIYITARTASATDKFSFYGPAVRGNLANIQDISAINTGLRQTFNYLTWKDAVFGSVGDATSQAKYGIKKRQLATTLITDTTKQQNILTAFVSEFGLPKDNFSIKTPITYATLNLFFLDKVIVDYPTVYIASKNNTLPFYGRAYYGRARYPIKTSALTINPSRRFKLMGINILVKDQLIDFKLKEV